LHAANRQARPRSSRDGRRSRQYKAQWALACESANLVAWKDAECATAATRRQSSFFGECAHARLTKESPPPLAPPRVGGGELELSLAEVVQGAREGAGARSPNRLVHRNRPPVAISEQRRCQTKQSRATAFVAQFPSKQTQSRRGLCIVIAKRAVGRPR